MRTVAIIILLLGFVPFEAAAETQTQAYVINLARENAEVHARWLLDNSAAWTQVESPLQKQLYECRETSSSFSPKLRVPGPDSPITRAICDEIQSRKYLEHHSGYKESCDFVEYTPCSFQITKRVELNTMGKIMDGRHFGAGPEIPVGQMLPTHEVAFISVACKQVADLGLYPKWVCASDYDWTWNVGECSWMASYSPPFVAAGHLNDQGFIFRLNEDTRVLKQILNLSGLVH